MQTTIAPDTDQETRIARLREELAQLGALLTTSKMPADTEEEFLRHVLEYETAEPITLLRLLENAGYEMPPPDTLDDTRIDVKLGEALSKMATLGAYVIHTDHLTGRELYEYLFNEGLREEAVLFPENAGYSYIIDLTGSGSDAHIQLWLKHYASEEYRQRWAQDWPDDHIPAHEDPPYPRDAHLPKPPASNRNGE